MALTGGSGNATSWQGSITGQVIYDWLWSPPGGIANFPQPPLYVLQRSDLWLQYAVNDNTNVQGLSVGGNASDSLGDALSVAGPPFSSSYLGGPLATGHKVQVASGAPSVSASVTVSMSETISGTATATSGSMWPAMAVSESMFPIVLSSPDPLTRPDLGSGTNQFLYDSTMPNGKLVLAGVVAVVGSTADDTNWVVNDPGVGQSHVSISTDLPAESKLMVNHLQWANGQVSYVYGTSAPYPSGMGFIGLPASNSGLGNHLSTLMVDGKASQQAHIQTFFTGVDASGNTVANYPNASNNLAPDKSIIPNWYYYYSQVYKLTVAQGGYDHAGQTPSHIDLTPPYAVHIHDDAYGSYSLPVYSLSKPILKGEFVQYLGTLSVIGIHSYIFICAHELGHQALSQQVDASGEPVVYNWYPKDASGNYTLPLTTDGDHVVDGWEQTHHLDASKQQTTLHTYANTNDFADDEVIADIQGLGALFTNLPQWSKDWADGGIQHGQTYFNPQPTGTQEGFYLTFTPADASQAAFHVHNLGDMTTHYASKTILTDVVQMVGP